MAEKTPLDSLPSLHEYLEATYRRAPSLVTLKRWAAAGDLRRCEVHRLTNRISRAKGSKDGDRARGKTRYNRQKAVEVIGAIWDLTPIAPTASEQRVAATPAAVQSAGASPADIAPLLEVVGHLETKIEDLRSTVASVTQALSQLNGVRAMLMSKYDATSAHQSEIIELLRKRAAEAENNSSLARDVQALRISVSNLQASLTRG